MPRILQRIVSLVLISMAFEKVWRVHFSDEFLRDQKNKTLTLSDVNMNIREFEYIMEHHLPKLKAKYPSYSLVVPPYLQHLQDQHNKAPF